MSSKPSNASASVPTSMTVDEPNLFDLLDAMAMEEDVITELGGFDVIEWVLAALLLRGPYHQTMRATMTWVFQDN